MSSNNSMAGIRQALRTFQYGLFVLTSGQGADVHAATITWVTQVSFSPRRIAIGVRKDSHIYPMLKAYGTFALNVVGEGQEALASTFFKYVEAADHQFEGYEFVEGPATGAPLFPQVTAWLECRVIEEANEGGDHALFVAEILAGDRPADAPQPLSLAATKWSYGG